MPQMPFQMKNLTTTAQAETQTEAFDYLYRKTSKHQAPDRNAETQKEEFDYLFLNNNNLIHLYHTLHEINLIHINFVKR